MGYVVHFLSLSYLAMNRVWDTKATGNAQVIVTWMNWKRGRFAYHSAHQRI
jgi:hypothetical protein